MKNMNKWKKNIKKQHRKKVHGFVFGTGWWEMSYLPYIRKNKKSYWRLKDNVFFSLPSINYRGFSEQKISAGLTLGHAITDYLKLLLYYRVEKVELFNTIDSSLFNVEEASGVRDPLEGIVEYDSRNDRMFPTAGVYSRGSVAYTGAVSKFDYFTFSGNFRWYQKLFWNFVFRMNIQYSRHLSLDEGGYVPFDRLFSLGGINSLRGFNYFSIGPRTISNQILEDAKKYQEKGGDVDPEFVANRVYGGYQEFYTNLEIQFPILQAMRLMGVVFVDVGRVFK